MRVLVACEYSATVRDAFAAKEHDAWSCDLLPTEGNSEKHYQGDVFEFLKQMPDWDLVIAHPPCTYLTNAGVRWLYSKEGRWAHMEEGARLFKQLLDLPLKHIAVENPIMHKYAVDIIGRRQDQVVQPWMFGHTEQKGTGLWLKNLPLLYPTNVVRDEMLKLPISQSQKVWHMTPSPDRWKLRSKTYQGIADAMASQWG